MGTFAPPTIPWLVAQPLALDGLDLGPGLDGFDRTMALQRLCALPELQPPGPEYHRVAASAHAASGAARSLALEYRATDSESGEGYAAYDLRGAEWRASLAARQTDEALQTED